MNLKTNQKGFTIVELLIVIVVIAILAAISIVAYTGIQDRARTSTGQQLAAQVQTKAQAFYTLKSAYPADFDAFNATDVKEANLEGMTSTQMLSDTVTKTSANSGKAVSYKPCTASGATAPTGADISYWDFTVSTGNVKTTRVGSC